jgi:hypothetical protein
LAVHDPNNAEGQRDLILSLSRIGYVTGDKTVLKRALDIAESLQNSGKLDPRDAGMVDKLRQLIAP